jgi:hypothetical protein
MLDLLRRGREHHGFVAVKAEFEAEGTRPDEFLRLLELARRADLKVALKIGGCEAVSDLLASKLYGVDYVVAPMVETAYALQKFIEAVDKTHSPDEQSQTDFLFNLETGTTLRNLDEMLPLARQGVDGIVFGRVDFAGSRGLSRKALNDQEITDCVIQVASACANEDIELVVGGSVSIEAIDALRQVRAVRLDRFETRKVVFDAAVLDRSGAAGAIAHAVDFELAWLTNKRAYYSTIAAEDAERIKMIEARVVSAPAMVEGRAISASEAA